MSEDTTTTEAPVSEGGDAQVDSAAPQPEQTEQAEAEVTVTPADNSTTEQTNENKGDDIAGWAKSKGLEINPDNPNEVKLAQMQREAEKKMHESTSQASELKNIINEEASSYQSDDANAQLQQDVQVMKANQAVNDFYQNNPDARQYDADMAKIVRENPNAANAGIEALYALAKVRSMQNGGEEKLKQEGKTEGLKDLSIKQKVASVTSSATSSSASAPKGVSREDVATALQNHDIQWLRDNQAAIDAL